MIETRSSAALLFLILLLNLTSYSRSWSIIRIPKVHGSRNRSLFATEKNGVNGDHSKDNDYREFSAGRRRRCVDYPSFAYGKDDEPLKRKKFVQLSEPVENSFNLVSNVKNFARRTQLLKDRSYAQKEPFDAKNMFVPPSLRDLNAPTSNYADRFFVSTPANIISFAVAYFLFPTIIQFTDEIIKISETQINEMLTTFAPGVSILYGTFVSLTLSILYNRQRTIQDNVAVECSLLTVLLRSLLSLFRRDECKVIEAGQCCADQIRTLVRSSRGEELMLLMYNDPYARVMELVDLYEEEQAVRQSFGRDGSELISFCRDSTRDLMRYRAKRLSDESLALPPTHFFILNILTVLILLCYVISVIPTIDPVTGDPSETSALLFGSLACVYVLFYNFATDLNNPFNGVYQIRRSCAASHLLAAKWVIANHPLLRGEVDFEEVMQEEDGGVLIRSPGVGDFWFERDDIFFRVAEEEDNALQKNPK